MSRFDGASWKTFTTSDGLAHNYITCMVVDHSGNLWAGNYDYSSQQSALSRYDGQAWRSYTTADGLPSNWVFSMCVDHAGVLWLGTLSGATSYDGLTWRTYTTDDGLIDNRVDAVYEDRRGNLWFGTGTGTQGGTVIGGGLSRFDRATSTMYSSSANGLTSDSISCALEDHLGNIWLGTNAGVSRFDGVQWTAVSTYNGLVDDAVHAMLEDRSGNLWFGTPSGVSRFDGTSWRTFTTADGLMSDNVVSLLQDHLGNMWFGTWYGGGASRFDGSTWTSYPPGFRGPPDSYVSSMMEDRMGGVWFSGFGSSVTRFDGTSWRLVSTGSGQVFDGVFSMLEDRSGNLWFGRHGNGAARFDGSTWRTFGTANGMSDDNVNAMVNDGDGNVWFATNYGASRFDGTNWISFTRIEGLPGNTVTAILPDHRGDIWFGTSNKGVARVTPDHVPPKTVFVNVPPSTTSARDLAATFIAAYGETKGVQYSYRFDGGAWSPWAPTGAWSGFGLPDGTHTLEARSRDYSENVDPYPATTMFTVDGTPPSPSLTSPSFGEVVRGTVSIRGTTADPRLLVDSVLVRPAGALSWSPPEASLLARSAVPVTAGVLASWNSAGVPDGSYEIRLSALDSLGLAGTSLVTVLVDNQFPYVDVTTPASVTAAGGDVYTPGQEIHLHFSLHSFVTDAVVSITSDPGIPSSLGAGVTRALPGYDISWSTPLRKSATLEFATAGSTPATGMFAVYDSSGGAAWQRLGGTLEDGKVRLVIQRPGTYALFAETTAPETDRPVSSLEFTPRVFSPAGTFAEREVGISFNLGKPAPVTVRVYSRSGRLIREVLDGKPLQTGANLVPWDGRDRSGEIVADGLYLVTVEAVGHTERKTLAVVR